MRQKQTFLLGILLACLGFQSTETNNVLIKKVTNLKTGTYTTYSYDMEGKVLSVVNSKGPTLSYIYSAEVIVQQFLNPLTGETKVDSFYVSNNRAVKICGNTYGSQKIEYDSKGRFGKSVAYVDGAVVSTSKFEWEGNNQKAYTAYDENGKLINRVEYSYYTDKINLSSEKEIGKECMGQHSKNLLKHSKGIMYALSSIDTVELNYYYKINPNGTLSLKVVYDKTGMLVDSLAYTY